MGWDTQSKKQKRIADFCFEKEFWAKGILVGGIDEAGRGALAGPVFAACVVYPIGFDPDFVVMDSKLISFRQRERLFEKITSNALFWSFSFVDSDEIDSSNILLSTHKAMENAIRQIPELKIFYLIDGNSFGNRSIPHRTIVDGDLKCISIASASIIAKVLRDRWMCENAHSKFPEYGFDKHKGYGTQAHIQNLKKLGITPIHRKSFLKKIIGNSGSLRFFSPEE